MSKVLLKEITSLCELAHLILQERGEQSHKNSSDDEAVEDWYALQQTSHSRPCGQEI